MLVEIVDRADVETSGRSSGGGIGTAKRHGSGLVKYFTSDGQLFGYLTLQQPTDVNIVAIGCSIAVVDPVTATAIGVQSPKLF